MFAANQRFRQGSQRTAVVGWTRGNTSVQISSTQSKFPDAGSLDLTNNVANAVLISANNQLTRAGTGPYTIEAWFYPTSRPNNFPQAIGNDNNTSFVAGDWGIYPGHNSFPTKWQFWAGTYSAAVPLLTSTSTITNNTWTHIAITRGSSNDWTMWVNGSSEATATQNINLDNNASQTVQLGSVGTATLATRYIGYLSEIRVSKVCRYTATFTPNADGPFINDPDTLLLFHGSGPATNFIDDNS